MFAEKYRAEELKKVTSNKNQFWIIPRNKVSNIASINLHSILEIPSNAWDIEFKSSNTRQGNDDDINDTGSSSISIN